MMFRLVETMCSHKGFVSGQCLCFSFSPLSSFAEKNFFLLIFLFVFFSRNLSNGRSFENCAVMRHGIMQFNFRFCNNFFNSDIHF